MSNALETLAMVIQGADEYTEHVGDGSWSERIAEAVLAYLTSDEAVMRADRAARQQFLIRPMPGDVGRAAVLAAVGGNTETGENDAD